MAYYLDFSDDALQDAQEALEWMEQHSPKYAADWYIGLMDAIFSLEEMPRRCSFAPENDLYNREVRHLLYTKRSVTYRVIFVIVKEAKDEEPGEIRVYRIRHGAQRPLTAGEFKRGERD